MLSSIDELMEELKSEFNLEALVTDSEVESFAKIFDGDPILEGLPLEVFSVMLKAIFNRISEGFLKELTEFTEHFKNKVPSEEELAIMTDGQRANIVLQFEEEMDPVAESWMKKTDEATTRHREERNSVRVKPLASQAAGYIFSSREDAERVLDAMSDFIESQGYISVATLEELIDVEPNHIGHRYGWKDLKDVKIHQVRDGWMVEFPKPEVFDNPEGE